MADDLTGIIGGQLLIEHSVLPATSTPITAATITIVNPAAESGEEVVIDAAAMTVTAGTGVEGEDANGIEVGAYGVAYNFDTDGADAGDYHYVIIPTPGEAIRGGFFLWPVFSRLERYVRRVKRWVKDSNLGEDQQTLSDRDYLDALNVAVEAYSRGAWDPKQQKLRGANPQMLSEEVSLTADVWEYDLEDLPSYSNDFSRFVRVEYPVAADQQTKYYLATGDWQELPREGVWRFLNAVPTTGEEARITYTAPHSLSHTADTIPAYHFEALCKFAAGVVLLGPQAFLYLRTNAPEIGAQFLNYEPRSNSAHKFGLALMEQAMSEWESVGVNAAANTSKNRAWTLDVGCVH